MSREEAIEKLARKLAFQTLEDECECITEDDTWSWVVREGFVQEYMDKAGETLNLIESIGYRLIPELKPLSDEEIKKHYKKIILPPEMRSMTVAKYFSQATIASVLEQIEGE